MNDGQDEARAEVAQEGDMAEVAQAAPARMNETRDRLIGGAAAGQAREAMPDPPGEIRQRRGQGRRINLRRSSDGSYSIWMQNRLIQSFCGEWEDITRFQLPEGIQQQCRITVHSLGEAREWSEEETRGQDRVQAERPDDGVELRTIAHPNNPPMFQDDLLSMFNALPRNNQEIIAGQIRSNYEEYAVPPEVARTEVTIQMFDEMQRQLVELASLVHQRPRQGY